MTTSPRSAFWICISAESSLLKTGWRLFRFPSRQRRVLSAAWRAPAHARLSIAAGSVAAVATGSSAAPAAAGSPSALPRMAATDSTRSFCSSRYCLFLTGRTLRRHSSTVRESPSPDRSDVYDVVFLLPGRT